MNGFWIVVGAGVGTGLLVYAIGKLLSKLSSRIGEDLDAVSWDASDLRRPEPPPTRHPHRPIY
jgi:hypothetical protein